MILKPSKGIIYRDWDSNSFEILEEDQPDEGRDINLIGR